MPIPTPHKGESKSTYLSRCASAIYDEYKGVEGQTIAICETSWKHHAAKASLVVAAAGDEWIVETEAGVPVSSPPPNGSKCPVCKWPTSHHTGDDWSCDNGHHYSPRDAVFTGDSQAAKDPRSPIPKTVHSVPQSPVNDDGSNQPNTAPPAAPFPATVAPKSSAPKDKDDDTAPGPDNGDSTQDSPNDDEYVGGRKVEPKNPGNLGGGGLAPNPDNATDIPQGGVKPIDSNDDNSAKPKLSELNVYMGSLQLEVDEQGMAKWPLTFKTIDKDVKRPAPDTPVDHSAELDPVKDFADNKPYVI